MEKNKRKQKSKEKLSNLRKNFDNKKAKENQQNKESNATSVLVISEKDNEKMTLKKT